MAELAFREGIMDRIRIREPRFHEQAYLFVKARLADANPVHDAFAKCQLSHFLLWFRH